MDRIILHSDINNFFASVEVRLNPELDGKCIAVAGDPKKRHGIVLAKSNQAKAYGVKTAEALWQAKQKCPQLIFVPPNYKKYTEYSRAIFEIYTRYTDLVESFGIDECWLDTSGSVKLFGDGQSVAERIRKDIKNETGLSVSIGVSFNKIFAKLGSDIKKPDAVTVISKENFKDVVWQLPTHAMIYIGKQTAKALSRLGINTIGELARADKNHLARLFGKMGAKFYEYAWGRDTDPVARFDDIRLPESVGNGTTTACDISTIEDAERVIYALCEVIAYRLRQLKMIAGGVSINIRDKNLKSITRQELALTPIFTASQLAEKAVQILKANYNFSTMLPLRTITVATYSLSFHDAAYQMSLFEDNAKDSVLESNIDKLRDKYGASIVQRALNLDTPYSCDTKEIDEDFIPFDKGSLNKQN